MIVESFKLGSTDIDFFEELIVNVDLSLLSRRNAREDLDLFLRRSNFISFVSFWNIWR